MMQIHEIENLSFPEIKQRREELADAAREFDHDQLVARYVQARMDAKQRDEKLAEQGETIRNLNSALEAAKKQVNQLTEQATERKAAINDLDRRLKALRESSAKDLEAARQAHFQEVSVLNEQVQTLTKSLNEQSERADRLKAEARIAYEALHEAEKSLKDALSFRRVEAADQGD